MKNHFLRLAAYDHAAAQRQLAVVEDCMPDDQAVLKLLSHILAAQQAWLLRLRGQSTDSVDIWKVHALDSLMHLEHVLHHEWLDYLTKSGDDEWTRQLTYTNYAGNVFTNSVSDIVTHVFNHSTYHRAQVSTLIRQAGNTPPSIDFIGFARGLF
jgi:uncharacterized damage-inducible protein DinB